MTPITPLTYLQNRRNQLAKNIQNGIVILPTAPQCTRNNHTTFPFRPDSNFLYLTDFPEPEAIAVWEIMDGSIMQSTLFCRPSDPDREIWEGPRYGPDKAKSQFGFDQGYPIDEFTTRIQELLLGQTNVYYPFHAPVQWDHQVTSLVTAAEAKRKPGTISPSGIFDLRPSLAALRLIKDSHEIQTMRQAAAISVEAHRRAMAATKPGRYEYEIEAELLYQFRKADANAPAYPSIVASGPNACILHSVTNNRPLNPNELILVDAACEWGWYASDITRTWPTDGQFQGAQREIYLCVLTAQAAAINAVRPGASADAPHQAAIRVLTQGLMDLGLLPHMTLDDALETKAYSRFYMHRTSHWIGLDVHDVGPSMSTDPAPILQPGQLLTIEPGLYCPIADDIPSAFQGIGVRIEDEVLVTETGMENLTGETPKQIADIEALVGTA